MLVDVTELTFGLRNFLTDDVPRGKTFAGYGKILCGETFTIFVENFNLLAN